MRGPELANGAWSELLRMLWDVTHSQLLAHPDTTKLNQQNLLYSLRSYIIFICHLVVSDYMKLSSLKRATNSLNGIGFSK